MLIDFTFGNFGPFREDATISMQATSSTEHDNNLIKTDLKDDLLSSAIIFGPNAAGKTSVIDALYSLRYLVKNVDDKRRATSIYNPFRLSKGTRESPVRMRIRLLLDGIKYDYKVEYLEGIIVNESLYHYPKGRSARVFERTDTRDYLGAKKRIVSMTSDSMTYLAMAGASSDPICSKVRRAILDDIIILPPNLDDLIQDSCRFMKADPSRKEMAIEALNTADFGVKDYTSKERKLGQSEISKIISQELLDFVNNNQDLLTVDDVFIKHSYTGPDFDDEGLTFPLGIESSGTQCMFGLVSPMIDALEKGKLLVMDELGAHMHPSLTRWIVKQFSSENNPNGAQLIANTHDISLMDISELFRRDQIWFVNKDRSNGSSELYCLSDFDGVRKDADVMKAYLLGRFDAIPKIRHRGVIR